MLSSVSCTYVFLLNYEKCDSLLVEKVAHNSQSYIVCVCTRDSQESHLTYQVLAVGFLSDQDQLLSPERHNIVIVYSKKRRSTNEPTY